MLMLMQGEELLEQNTKLVTHLVEEQFHIGLPKTGLLSIKLVYPAKSS